MLIACYSIARRERGPHMMPIHKAFGKSAVGLL
jgi:hypothetical protein